MCRQRQQERGLVSISIVCPWRILAVLDKLTLQRYYTPSYPYPVLPSHEQRVMWTPRDAGALGSVRNDVILTSKHTTLYDSDKSATADCDKNANPDDRVLKPPIKVWVANQRKPLAGSDWKLDSL